MNIKADYVVGNFGENEFKNLGVLYNQENGKWFANRDNFVSKPKKDVADIFTEYVETENFQSLSDYKVGTNAIIFNPAGGLRISFEELGNCLEMIMNGGNFRGKKIVREDLLNEIYFCEINLKYLRRKPIFFAII